MPYVWDPNKQTWGWDFTPAASGAFDIDPYEPTFGEEYQSALQQWAPDWTTRPRLQRYLGRAQAPLKGAYQAFLAGIYDPEIGGPADVLPSGDLPGTYARLPGDDVGVEDRPSFATWLSRRGTGGAAGFRVPTHAYQRRGFNVGGLDIDWSHLGGYAREMSEIPGVREGQWGTGDDITLADRWDPIIGEVAANIEGVDPTQNVRDLIALAQYQPGTGYSANIRRGAQAVAQRKWAANYPGATDLDWLGYITGTQAPGFLKPSTR